MSDFFKPEDFDDEAGGYTPACSAIARLANAKLKAHIESLPVALGRNSFDEAGGMVWWDKVTKDDYGLTHRACLWDIQPLEKKECEHEPYFPFAKMDLDGKIHGGNQLYENECRKCGKKLKAKWEPVDE